MELLDHPRLMAQLCGLDRRTALGGRDCIDHGPGGHDDLINAVAGGLVEASRRTGSHFSLDAFIAANASRVRPSYWRGETYA